MQNIIHALTQTRSHSTIIFKLSTKLNIKCMQNLGTYKNCIINLMTKSSNINQFGYKIPEANCVCVSPVEFLISIKDLMVTKLGICCLVVTHCPWCCRLLIIGLLTSRIALRCTWWSGSRRDVSCWEWAAFISSIAVW